MRDYRKLDVWTKSHELALDVHRAPLRVSVPADAACAGDLARAARLIPSLIVRGCESETAEEFALAMREAASAVDDLAYRICFARDAGMLDAVPYAKLEARAQRLRAMLGGLNRTVRLRMGAGDRAPRRPRETAADHAAPPEAGIRQAVARAVRGVRDAGSSSRESRR